MSKESKIEDLNFEASLKELEEIVERLESGQGSLEDAISCLLYTSDAADE